MKIWNIYAHYQTPCGYSSWQKVTLKTDTYEKQYKLYQDLKDKFGWQLCLNR